jgi:hypothetical protein
MCGYDVPGMISLQASYLYNYNILKGITFEVLPFSIYEFRPMMLPATGGNIFGTPVVEQLSVPSSDFLRGVACEVSSVS